MIASLHSFAECRRGGAAFLQSAARGADLGRYHARQQPNGDYCIHKVDIFQPTSKQNPGTGDHQVFGEEWMRQAADGTNERIKRGYKPPVHIGHHDPKTMEERPFAGHFENLRVEPNPDGIPTLYADIVDIPPEMFAQVMRNRIPYRSIEVNKPMGPPEVSSLAFMQSRVPHHKLPLLRVELVSGDLPNGVQFHDAEQPRQFAEVAERGGYAHAVAYTAQGEHHILVQQFAADYAPIEQPTAFMQGMQRRRDEEQDMPSRRSQHFSPGEMREEDYGDGEEDMGGEGGSIEDLLSQLSEEDLAQLGLLDDPMMDPQDGGDDIGLQDDGGMSMGITPQQLTSMIGEAVTRALAESNALGSAPTGVTPPPAAAGENTTQAAQFAEGRQTNASTAAAASRVDRIEAALFGEDGRGGLMGWMRDLKSANVLNAVTDQAYDEADAHHAALQRDGLADHFGKTAQKAIGDHIENRIAQFGVDQWAAWTPEQRSQKLGMNQWFAEFRQDLPGGTVAPPPSSNGVRPQQDDGAVQFSETPQQFAERQDIKAVFAELNIHPSPEDINTAQLAEAEWRAAGLGNKSVKLSNYIGLALASGGAS